MLKRPTLLIAYRAGSDVAGKAAFFLVTVAAARRLSQADFGIFSLASTVGWMAAVAADFGVQLHLARAVARQPADADQLLPRWVKVRISFAGMVLVAVAAGLALIRAARPHAAAILLFVALYLVSGLIELLNYFYRGLSRSDLESTLTIAQRGATLCAALIALWWRPDVTLLAAAMLLPVAGTFASSAGLAIALSRAAKTDAGGSPSRLAASGSWRNVLAELTRDVLPLGAGIVLSAAYFRIDVFLVELWNGTHAVGLYNAVFRLVEGLRLFPAAALAVALPDLCRATTMRPLIRVSMFVTAFAALVTAAVWAMAGWLIPFLYGAAFADAVPAFRILLVAFPLMSLNYALTHQLIGWNGHRAYAAICASALAANVALNARLIPSMSIVGAAWSTVWTEVVLSIGCVGILWLRAGPDVESPVALGAS